MKPLRLYEYRHPNKQSQKGYDLLVGIDEKKNDLLSSLQNILDRNSFLKWLKKNHKNGLPFIENMVSGDCLVMLSGDVGCGKTELAHTVATPLSKAMGDEPIVVFETPSDIRGGGHVGELSSRITAAFEAAKSGLRKGEFGILIIDEADDLATSRDQMQAHHEDRSGVNVLIKELDKIRRENVPLAVIIITNRPKSIDPAVARRATLQISFTRPDEDSLRTLLERVFEGLNFNTGDFDKLVTACTEKSIPYSYSDITKRIARQSTIKAWTENLPLSLDVILGVIHKTEPSPQIL